MNSGRRGCREPLDRFTHAGRCWCERARFIMEDEKLISGEWVSGELSHPRLLFTPWARRIHHASAAAHAAHGEALQHLQARVVGHKCQYGIIHSSSLHPLGDYAKSLHQPPSPPPPKMLLLEIFTHNHHSIKKQTFMRAAGVFLWLLAAFQAQLCISILSAFDGVMEAHCVEALWVGNDSHAYSV